MKVISYLLNFLPRPQVPVPTVTPKAPIPPKPAMSQERYDRYKQPGYNRYDQERLNKEGMCQGVLIFHTMNRKTKRFLIL